MAMGLVDDAAFEAELLKKDNRVSSNSAPKAEVKDLPTLGRKSGDNEVPESLRKIIGEDAIENGNKSANAFAESLGISPSSVSAYKNGATSTATYNQPNSELSKHINKTRERIVTKVSNKLELALEELTSDKLAEAKPHHLASIARNMAAIIKDMEPEEKESKNQQNNQFIIMAPGVASLDDFLKNDDVIDMRNE